MAVQIMDKMVIKHINTKRKKILKKMDKIDPIDCPKEYIKLLREMVDLNTQLKELLNAK